MGAENKCWGERKQAEEKFGKFGANNFGCQDCTLQQQFKRFYVGKGIDELCRPRFERMYGKERTQRIAKGLETLRGESPRILKNPVLTSPGRLSKEEVKQLYEDSAPTTSIEFEYDAEGYEVNYEFIDCNAPYG